MDLNLAGKSVIVTGAASNIGRGIALGFAGEGARIAIVDIDDVAGRKVAALAEKRGAKEAVAINESPSGNKLNRETSPNVTAADKITKKSESAMPAEKSRRLLPLRKSRSPCEITLPIKTTGWVSQRGSPTARSKRKAPIKSAAEEFKTDGQFIDCFRFHPFDRSRFRRRPSR